MSRMWILTNAEVSKRQLGSIWEGTVLSTECTVTEPWIMSTALSPWIIFLLHATYAVIYACAHHPALALKTFYVTWILHNSPYKCHVYGKKIFHFVPSLIYNEGPLAAWCNCELYQAQGYFCSPFTPRLAGYLQGLIGFTYYAHHNAAGLMLLYNNKSCAKAMWRQIIRSIRYFLFISSWVTMFQQKSG